MKSNAVLKWAGLILILPLYLLFANCGGSSSTPVNPAPAPAAAPSASPSPSATPAATWSQITEKTQCLTLESSYCVGVYGFTVFPNGSYQVGPASDGQIQTGTLTVSELNTLASDAAAMLQTNLASGLTCVSQANVVGTNDTVLLTPTGQSAVVVYQQANPPTGSNCYAGGFTEANSLHNDLLAVMQKYYPIPFPAQSSSAVQAGSWGGQHAQAVVTANGATFKFECAIGQTNQKLTLDSAGIFQVQGTYTITSGPVLPGQSSSFPATYSGSVDGNTMNLTVVYTPSSGSPVTQNFQLTLSGTPTFDLLCAQIPPSPAPSSSPSASPTPTPSFSPTPTPSPSVSPSPSPTP